MRALVATTTLALVSSGLALVAAAPAEAAEVDVTVIGAGDLHGRIRAGGSTAGAAAIATYVKQVRAANPRTVFAAAGDLIGGSTFESYIARDKPTIDAMNAAGLDVAAVGSHELDKGYADLANRVMAPASTSNPDGGAGWSYLAANLVEPGGANAIASSAVETFNPGTPEEITVGFVGAVTERLPQLVAPAGIQGLQVNDVVAAVNAEAARLVTAGADAVVVLVNEGAPSADCATMAADPASDFGQIVTAVSGDVDAIISGRTHLAYDCELPKPGGGTRPVVSAGAYGAQLHRLDLTFDSDTDALTSISSAPVPLLTEGPAGTFTPIYPDDPATKAVVDAAVANAVVKGAAPAGRIGGALHRATRPTASGSGSEVNPGGESTLGNLVAESQRWATRTATAGAAKVAFIDPGTVRVDLLGDNGAGYPAQVTHQQAADVQPAADPLVNLRLTGAQLRRVLEQQWQPPGAARPFLRLGVSRGFTYTYDPATRRVTSMWLGKRPVVDEQTYSVTATASLAGGARGFTVFTEGTDRRETGRTDLDAFVSYVKARKRPLAVDYRQRAVGVQVPSGAPAAYGAGDVLEVDLSSLAYTGPNDQQDAQLTVKLAGWPIGTVRRVVNQVAPGAADDEAGRVRLSLRVPGGLPRGRQLVEITGATTGTTVRFPVQLQGDKLRSSLRARISGTRLVAKRSRPTVKVRVFAEGAPAIGMVRVRTGRQVYGLRLRKGVARVRLQPYRLTGRKGIRVTYLGTTTTRRDREVLRVRVVRRR